MIARIFGKSDIYNFKIEIFDNIKTFDFLKVTHQELGEILTQVINITRDSEKLIGDCKIIGYRNSGILKNIRTPFANDSNIEIATDDFIERIIDLNIDTKSFIGVLEHHPNLKISLDLKKVITKHITVLAKSGAGKSYTVGVLLEEVMNKNIPIVILDPHNEYSSMKYPNSDKKDLKRLEKFNLNPKGFSDRIKEYSPDIQINSHCEPISLDINTLKPQDLIESLPQKLSPSQQALIFNILSNVNNKINFDELIFNISNEESNAKWSLISLLEQLKKLKIYSSNPTPLNKLVKFKQTSIISLKGIEPYVLETFVSGLLKELFEARKKEEIPPFLLVLEEAHNFCPERSFGELKTSKIIRIIAGEGRKFGIGLCVISQRPAKVDKNVISQCSTQIILKITNPNDLKSVISSSEGVDSSSEKEIQKLNIGTCLLTGVIDIPLKINIRPRISKHGGETVDITLPYELEKEDNLENLEEKTKKEEKIFEEKKKKQNLETNGLEKAENTEFVQFISQEIEVEDAKTILDCKRVKINLIPSFIFKFKMENQEEISILFDRFHKTIVKTIFPLKEVDVPKEISKLSLSEKKIAKLILDLEDKFNPAQIMLNSNIMFNEILRICEGFVKKNLLEKIDRTYEITGLKFLKYLKDISFFGSQKFEEVSYDEKLKSNISESEVIELFSIFGEIKNIKEIFILTYDKG